MNVLRLRQYGQWLATSTGMRSPLLAYLVVLVPAVTHAQPAPEREREGSLWTDPELGFGAALAGLGFAGSVVWGRESPGDQNALWVPVLGPWLELSSLPDCGNRDVMCSHSSAERSVLIVTGIAQLAGVGLMAHALTKPRHKKPPVMIAPTMSGTGGGVQIRGRF
jgi:hypothetical protein